MFCSHLKGRIHAYVTKMSILLLHYACETKASLSWGGESSQRANMQQLHFRATA